MGSRIGQRGVGRGAELIQEAGPSSLAPEREQHRMAASGQRHQSCCFPYLKCNKNNVLPFKVRPHSHLSILGTWGEMYVSAYVFGNMCIICFVLVVPFFFKATPNVGCGPAFCHTKKAQNRDKQKHLAQSQKKKKVQELFWGTCCTQGNPFKCIACPVLLCNKRAKKKRSIASFRCDYSLKVTFALIQI